MARIIYKDGCEDQNRLECIEGIEINLLNGRYVAAPLVLLDTTADGVA